MGLNFTRGQAFALMLAGVPMKDRDGDVWAWCPDAQEFFVEEVPDYDEGHLFHAYLARGWSVA